MMNELPDFDKTRIDDVMVGNAMPEAEQGLNVARLISLMGLKVEDVPGVTVNTVHPFVGYSQNSIRNGTLYYCRW
jgi:acetyl-CoA acetyltransferase